MQNLDFVFAVNPWCLSMHRLSRCILDSPSLGRLCSSTHSCAVLFRTLSLRCFWKLFWWGASAVGWGFEGAPSGRLPSSLPFSGISATTAHLRMTRAECLQYILLYEGKHFGFWIVSLWYLLILISGEDMFARIETSSALKTSHLWPTNTTKHTSEAFKTTNGLTDHHTVLLHFNLL